MFHPFVKIAARPLHDWNGVRNMAEALSRREFAGVLATGSLLTGTVAVAADPIQKVDPPPAVPPANPIDLYLDLVKQQYPHEKLDELALDEVRTDIRHHLGRSKILSSHPLLNSDEPGFVFSAWRADQSRA